MPEMCKSITDTRQTFIHYTASSLLNLISYIVGTKCYYQLNRTEYIFIIKSIKPVNVLY